jgi:hypothetical protein
MPYIIYSLPFAMDIMDPMDPEFQKVEAKIQDYIKTNPPYQQETNSSMFLTNRLKLHCDYIDSEESIDNEDYIDNTDQQPQN